MGFNLHKTDRRYSVKNYFIGFARKFYPNLIYKQIKFRLFLQFYNTEILRYIEIIFFENDIIFAGLEFAKTIEIQFVYISNWSRIFWQIQ